MFPLATMTRNEQETLNEALQLSREYPKTVFYIFKKGKDLAVSGNDFVKRERILDHWEVIAKTQGGFFIL